MVFKLFDMKKKLHSIQDGSSIGAGLLIIHPFVRNLDLSCIFPNMVCWNSVSWPCEQLYRTMFSAVKEACLISSSLLKFTMMNKIENNTRTDGKCKLFTQLWSDSHVFDES